MTSNPLENLLTEMFDANERLSRDEIHRRAIAVDLPAALMTRVAALPEGDYAEDELREALGVGRESV